jgi:hypothetical protein
MQEIFLHFFEQYGAVTLLLLFCGCKGNGKSLRAERAKAVFPEGWAADGGMSSARAGMNGGNSTMNGCNVLYDEMIGDLCDSEGSDRLEVSSPCPLFSLHCHTHCLCFVCSQFWK